LSEYGDWVKTIFSTWGSNLANGVELVFLSCNKVLEENTWCAPNVRDNSEAFFWALRKVASEHMSVQWVYTIRLGTYVIHHNLNRYLSELEHEDAYFLGHRVVSETTAYHTQNAGFVLSLEAVRSLGIECREDHHDTNLAKSLSKCCMDIGVKVSATTTLAGEQRFNPTSIISGLISGNLSHSTTKFAKKSISFYNPSPSEAQLLHEVSVPYIEYIPLIYTTC